jgi:uncharacterized membrane protein YkvA (DUF1232 family)
MRTLARDPNTPRSVRWRLRIAVLYNVQPFNVIPDFIPVVGFADNVVVILWALRGVVRISGPTTVRRAWRGSPAGLELVLRLSGERPPPHG